ncbi:TatD family deoxyribonuclease [Treponema ruminis]|nr:TatD family hydrolase [Treponema ruminis]QSI01812.1 TatD family deoxyribonuclease [Treponema ruminis]
MTFCDSHLHLSKCNAFFSFSQEKKYMAVSSCHSKEDFDFLTGESLASFGIHPQAVNSSYMEKDFSSDLAYLESLLESKKIVAIGECGFDFFTPDFKSTAREQEIAFESQLDLAQKYKLPLVLHLRKSIEKIFTYSRELKKVPAVIFHSFPGTLREAESLKNHGLNAFFSFGKPLLNGKKSAIDCVKNLPVENLLFETDAPYQTLKDEEFTSPQEIERVYRAASEIRGISMEELAAVIEENFTRAFQSYFA